MTGIKLPDVNVLLYTIHIDSRHHRVALDWLEQTLNSESELGFAWLGLVGFIRISTQTRIVQPPLTTDAALQAVHDWLGHPRARILQPTVRHADVLARLLLSAGTAGNLTNDAHLAALAIEHNAEVVSFDPDFKRFSGLKFQLLS